MSRIAIVSGAGIVSGKEIMALELANGLRSRGHRVELITSAWGNGEFNRRLQSDELPRHVMRLGFISATLTPDAIRMTLHQLCYWPALFLTYRQLLQKFKPEWGIHTTWHHVLLLLPFLRSDKDIY